MAKILSVSRRTDIPAWYGQWFMNRIEEGFAGFINPYGGKKHLVSLKPVDVSCFVFWSKNFTPFLSNLKVLSRKGYHFYFNYTLTGLPAFLEANTGDTAEGLKTMQELSRCYGSETLNWRYDPIILSDTISWEWHKNNFTQLASQLEGYVNRCYFSFMNFYSKLNPALVSLRTTDGITIQDPPLEKKQQWARELAAIASGKGITLFSCCNDTLLSPQILKARCIDGELIRRLYFPQGLSCKSKGTRRECGCCESTDIGRYDTCPAGCLYCYANGGQAQYAFSKHDPAAPFLGFSNKESRPWADALQDSGYTQGGLF